MEKLSKSYDLTNLADFKEYLYTRIDENSSNQIFEGFTFDSKSFSLSISAQINWSNLMQIPDQFYPLTISCTDESTYVLTAANKLNFYLACVNAKNSPLQAGTLLKQTVKDYTTIQECQALLDTL